MKTEISSPDKSGSSLIWLGIFLFFFGLLFAVSGWFAIQSERKFENRGKIVSGTVLGRRTDESWQTDSKTNVRSKTTNFHIRYHFDSPESGPIDSESSVSNDQYSRAQEGAPITIEFVEGDPSNNRVAHPPQYIAGGVFLAVGSLILLAGASILYFDYRTKARNKRLMEDGMSTEATVRSVAPGNLSINDVQQWRIEYSFTDLTGREQVGKTPHLSPAKAKKWKLGDKGSVKYDRNDPKINLWIGKVV